MFGVAMEAGPKQLLSPESAAAAELFDQFVNAQTFKGVLGTFRLLCDTLRIKPTNFPNFYPKLKAKLRSWKAQALWAKIEKRANHKCYNRGKACANTRVLIIGAGPCGLRTAIEAQLLGAKVVVIEKRDRLSRNNVLHLWPFVIHDLRSLGAKKFYGKFCVGAIDHISIRQLQCVLLKVALLIGVEVHENVSFDDFVEPPLDQSQEKIGWKPLLTPREHPVSQYEFDVLVGADGKRNTLKSFKRKEFRGKLAIAITANFINRHSEAEARVQEISGVAFIFNQKFFQDLRDHTGIDLENIVYYKDETHYFVMTAKKYSLIEKGVILNDYADTAKLLAPDNVSREALLVYAREAADFSTNFQMPDLDFAVNHYGQADVAMFDFTSMFAAESASRVIERRGHKLLQALVGDSLLEPFWPTGSGCARGFLSSLDACWMIRSWSLGCMTPFQVLAQRESIYRLLAQTTPENLSKDYSEYTVDPTTRYPNLNLNAVFPVQVKGLYDTDSDLKDEPLEIILPKKKRKRDSHIHPDALLSWCQRQVILCRNVSIENMTISWKNGLAFCAIIHRYRPDLIDFNLLKEEEAEKNNQLAFDVCEREFGILPIMTGKEMAESTVPDALAIVSYVSQIYDTFRGEIPYIARAPFTDLSPEDRPASPSRKSPSGRFSFLSRLGQRLSSKKRYSFEKNDPESEKEKADALRRAKKKRSLERDRALFILNKDSMPQTVTSCKIKTEVTIEDRENFNTRVKDLEEKLYGTGQRPTPSPSNTQKVGKIGRGDWNVKMLEERLKGTKPVIKKERVEVPKWSRDIFEDKLRAMDQKPRSDSSDEPAKFTAFDSKLHILDKKLKEGNNLDIGQRGMNKVSAMAEHITSTIESRPQSLPLQRSNSKPSIPVVNVQNASEVCHFCRKRVYLMERHSAQGKFFHRGCFKCEYCNVSLRLGNYGMGTEGSYNGKFLCMHHFNMRVIPQKRPGVELGNEAKRNTRRTPTKLSPVMKFETPTGGNLELPDTGISKLRGVTPERVEFENTLDLTSEEELLSEIDEDDWTERNFGNTTTDMGSSDEESDFSSDEMKDDELEEALQKSLSSAQTLKLAESWKRRHSKDKGNNMEYDEEYDSDDDDYDESGEDYSYEEYENEDDESTATDGEVHDGAGEGPSEQVTSPAVEVTREGDVQLEVPLQTNNNLESVDYETLKSNEESVTGDDSASRTSDSELFSGSDTETDSDTEDGDQDDGERGIEGDKESDEEENPYRIHRSRSRSKKRKHFIPTIVIDEMTSNALNEDDDSYFITLQEQNLKAEKTLGDLIHEQIIDSAVQTPETPCFVQEEMCPLVPRGSEKSFDMQIYELKQPFDRNTSASADSVPNLKADMKSKTITTSQHNPDLETGKLEHKDEAVLMEITQGSATHENLEENLTQQNPVDDLIKSDKIDKILISESDMAIEDCGIGVNLDVKIQASCILPEQTAFQELSSLPELHKDRDSEKETFASGNSATESPSLKMMLKLKERYLLGNASSPEPSLSNVLPSPKITPAKLEPVVKSFLEVISEKQKMLSPAITPSPSSPSSAVSSDPSYIQGSSSWSKFSPVSSLSICSTSPSPSGESKSSDICIINENSDVLTLSINDASLPVDNSLSAGLMTDICEQILDESAENNKTCDANIESNVGEANHEVENKLLQNEESSCALAEGKFDLKTGNEENEVGLHLINMDRPLKAGFEKEIHPSSLSPPVSPRVVDVYSDTTRSDVQQHPVKAANPDEILGHSKEDIMEHIENVQLNVDSEMQNIVNGNDLSVTFINEDRDDNLNDALHFQSESKLSDDSANEIIDESIFDNIDTRFITFRDKSKHTNSDSKSKADEINFTIFSYENDNNTCMDLDTDKNKEALPACSPPDIKMEDDVVNTEDLLVVKEGSLAEENVNVNIQSTVNTDLSDFTENIEQTLNMENKNELSQPKLSEMEEVTSKNYDDDSLGMLSNSGSSDSDTTPSLDESIYTTPQAVPKPIPKHMSYLGHFAEHSFPFGGVRDSIDIRKSAMKKLPSAINAQNGSYVYVESSSSQEPQILPIPSLASVKQPQGSQASKEAGKNETMDEIPFVDDESSQESPEQANKNEQFFTPRTSYKRPLQRPLSMIETRCSSGSPLLAVKKNALPDTPLINTETFSTPGTMVEAIEDLRQLRTVEREKARQLARERARLKSDEELGLRTVDYKKLRRKYQKTDSNASSDIQEEKSSTDESPIKGESMLHFLQSENEEMELSPDSVHGSEEAALPSLERFTLSNDSQSSSPDSEVFENSLPPVSPCDNEKFSMSPTSGSSDVVPQSSSMGSSMTASFSEVKKDSATTSGSASVTSKTDPAYLEPELSIEEVDLKISSGSNQKSTSSCSSLGNSPTKTKSSSLPGLMSRKDKTKNKPDSSGTDKTDKSKPKERKSLLSIFTSFGKSDPLKSKNKEKDEKDKKKEKSPSPSAPTSVTDSLQAAEISHLEGTGLKVDGTPKESRFPKLRLARSKEKAKEKRKQKYLKESSPSPPKEVAPPVIENTPPPPKESTPPLIESVQSLMETTSAKEIIPEKEIAAPTEEVNPPPTTKNVPLQYLESNPQGQSAAKSTEMTFDRHAVIASLATISKQIPSGSKIGNGVAPQASEDSFSDPDDDTTEEKSHASSTCSSKKSKATSEDRKRKYERLAQRMYRQQEQKRLRTAQEIQRQLEELEVKQRELETRGVQVEKALRGEGEGQDSRKEEPELMQEWFHLVHSKNVLVRKEQEMMVKAKELELEDRHSRLQNQLHQRMAIDDSTKTQEEIDEEGRILAEMLEIVDQRDTLIALLEENRQIYQEQDRDLELSMQAKGLKFSSPTKS